PADTVGRGSSRERQTRSGKTLRHSLAGKVPDAHPFDESLVFTLGHRTPQGIAWDEQGTMYASEFGQDTWDELNVIEAGGNYGWPEAEGGAGEGGSDDFTDPVQQWPPSEASPSGMAVTDQSIVIAGLRGPRLHEAPAHD